MLNNSMAEPLYDQPEVILKLDRNQIPAGELLTGSFFIWPDLVGRTDTAITIEFVMKAQVKDEVVEQKIEELQSELPIVSDDGSVQYHFSYRLPNWLTVSTHAVRYYLKPHFELKTPWLDFDGHLNGMEAIIVKPNRVQAHLIDLLSQLGFQEKLDSRFWDGNYQEFDFVAGKSAQTDVKELTIWFQPLEQTTRVHLYRTKHDPVSFDLQSHQEQDAVDLLRKYLHLE
ncbi:sporulation protein [Effusibacillus dendaii]|uniref:Uncharacterized protein n=1 Tax=Effusibacillus dendaii TaxID=2743772 RepID=A0A7I8DAP0_9BACL|nr:sporulation protein [Effusibacillus dendaii]BCJ85886.1 hypothetical protein skT53_08710 [Effusibacillus dendaii]